MLTRSPYWLPLSLLAGVALLSFWLEQAAKPDAANAKKGLGEPDAIVENFHSTLNGKNGEPLYQLTASRLRYYGKLNQTEVDNPVLSHLSAQDGVIHITSLHAQVAPEGKAVSFLGQVVLTHTPPKATRGYRLQSARIDAFPEQHRVSVPTAVSVYGPGLQLSAGGLEMDTLSRVLKLSGRVRAQYKT
ncbi:MAG TPA: LPS export ABC transporter periplasmic protein LptC [Thiobacillaceae bacterium]|nr:LPS export ABC transporter periplasmic protein LptC [Thiobacillaceae bacterium]